MATAPSLSRNFQRADGRAEFERTRRELNAELLAKPAQEASACLLEIGNNLDAGVARCKRELLASALCWNEDNQVMVAWICRQHREIAGMALTLAGALLEDAANTKELLGRVTAAAFFHWAEATKWSPARERPDYAPLHTLLATAIATGRERESFSWAADGRGHRTTLESLYFRALLLDRFASGSLTRQQVELLDAWMWEWTTALRSSRSVPVGAALRVDLDTNAGLREGVREGEGRSLYLALAPLETERRKIVKDLQRGRMVPRHGVAADFRIEEHVTLLDHLKRTFRDHAPGAGTRAPRQHAAGTRVEVWVGLNEILLRGIGVGTETGRWRALNLKDPSIDAHARARFTEATKRYLWLADTSASGLGFEAMESDAAGIEVGDLIGWRKASGGAVTLGVVRRRLAGATAGQVFLGVQLVTEAAQPLTLTSEVAFDGAQAAGTYLFVPGSDESGRHDAFLVSESTYQQHSTLRTRAGSNSYQLRFNRVRGRGRGWLLAGFEILPEQVVAPKRLEEDGPCRSSSSPLATLRKATIRSAASSPRACVSNRDIVRGPLTTARA
jgi:hypothetical protein